MKEYGLDGERRYLDAPMPRAHQHQDVELNFVETGYIRILCGPACVTVTAPQLFVFWAAWPHRIIEIQDCRLAWFTVPLRNLFAWDLPANRVSALMRGDYWLDPTPSEISGDATAIPRWINDLHAPARAPETLRCFETEIQARCRRAALAQNQAESAEQSSSASLSPALQALVATIARDYRETVSAETIAERAGFNPRYATALFRQTFGMGLYEYLVRQRLAHAQQQLLQTQQSVAEIAYASGFQSLSAFYERFKRVCGTSPLQYRQLREPPESALADKKA